MVDGILCREYTLSPASQTVVVPILSPGLHHTALSKCHDAPGAGHLGAEKTLKRLRSLVYWVGMSSDVEQYCQKCYTCQRAKPPNPQCSPLVNILIGRPWQMVAVGILRSHFATTTINIF